MTSNTPLSVESFDLATVYPVSVPPDIPNRLRVGVVRSDGSLVESTVEDRHHGTHLFIPPEPSGYDSVDQVPGEVIYAGAFYERYGHFLLECLARLWWAAERPHLPIVWVAPDDWESVPELSAWMRDMLSIVGVRNEVRILNRPTTFDVVHVPDAGYKYADWSHPDHIAFLAAYSGPPQIPGRKIWLSRREHNGIGLMNAEIIERKLIDRGWRILRPETLPLSEQLDEFGRAEVIAGEEGSAFHTLLLLKDISAKRFHVFRRHGPEHLSFSTIGEARQVNQQIHSCSHDAVVSIEGRVVSRLAPNPAQYLSHLGIPFAPMPEDVGAISPSHPVNRINRLAQALSAESYLQVGWSDPLLFTQVAVPHRDIVDTEFDFDVRTYRDRGAYFYEVTLERFLTWFANGRRYDLINIDAPRDWVSVVETLKLIFRSATHENTVVLLDNVADMYRAVLALHDMFPALSYRTVGAGSDSQAIIWREPRVLVPELGGLAAIAEAAREDVPEDVYFREDEAQVIKRLVGRGPAGARSTQ